MEPPGILAVAGNGPHLAPLPVTRGNIFSTHQDFSILINLYFPALENFADGSAADLRWVIHADERSCFRQSITLNGGKSQTSPEQFRVGFQRCAAGNDGPEFPAEQAMNPAKTPHAAEEF